MLAGTILGGERGARLPQAMRGAMRQPCFVAPLPEPVAETLVGERLTECGHKVSEMTRWRCVDRPAQPRQDRQLQFFELLVPTLLHLEHDLAAIIAFALFAELHDIRYPSYFSSCSQVSPGGALSTSVAFCGVMNVGGGSGHRGRPAGRFKLCFGRGIFDLGQVGGNDRAPV